MTCKNSEGGLTGGVQCNSRALMQVTCKNPGGRHVPCNSMALIY